MLVSLERQPIESLEAGALVVPVFEGEKPGRFAEALGGLCEAGEITGKSMEMTLLHGVPGMRARRLLAAGAGKRERFDAAGQRKLAGAAVRFLKSKAVRTIVFVTEPASEEYVAAAVEGAIAGDFEPDRYRSEKEAGKAVERFIVAAGEGAGLDAALERGRVVAEAQNFARELVNEPANRLTPTLLAERARATAAEFGLGFELLDRERMQQLGMGALLGVAAGSEEPPVLIVLRYRPEGAEDGHATHLGLVGKGITFDSGGISIKPSDGMEKMKYDMAGAASVMGAMKAIAALKPSITVTAVAPCVENMPGGAAQRPGDIVKTLNGKTVEVLNTDAEGRLILIDALPYAIRHLGCTHLVDAATLTGAIAVALASVHAGLFSNNDDLRDRVLAAARREGEKMWPLPMDDEYRKMLKSDFADIPNITGQRYGGAITAAKFLEEFVEDKPWAHLDIAGTAWLDEGKPWLSKGPSGITVRTLVRLALNWHC